jgi:hypothetical protein
MNSNTRIKLPPFWASVSARCFFDQYFWNIYFCRIEYLFQQLIILLNCSIWLNVQGNETPFFHSHFLVTLCYSIYNIFGAETSHRSKMMRLLAESAWAPFPHDKVLYRGQHNRKCCNVCHLEFLLATLSSYVMLCYEKYLNCCHLRNHAALIFFLFPWLVEKNTQQDTPGKIDIFQQVFGKYSSFFSHEIITVFSNKYGYKTSYLTVYTKTKNT